MRHETSRPLCSWLILLSGLLLVAPVAVAGHGGLAGLELRVLEESDAADPFSPANQDGRFDVNTVQVTFAAGPLGPRGGGDGTPGNGSIPVRNDLERHGLAVLLDHSIGLPGEAPVHTVQGEFPFATPFPILHLEVQGGKTAPFAVLTVELPWDGRDAAGSFVADGNYGWTMDAALFLPGLGDEGMMGSLTTVTGSITVDNAPPDLQTNFPLPVSLTDAEEVAVQGAAADFSGVSGVWVDGIEAAPGDRPGEWVAAAALARGENEITVAAEDAVGNRIESVGAGVRSEADLLRGLYFVAYDPSRDRAVLGDVRDRVVMVAELATGERSLLSGGGAGTGPEMAASPRVHMDRARDRVLALLWQNTGTTLLAVDPVTGDRTCISDPATAGGPEIAHAFDSALDVAHDRLLVTDEYGDALIGIDLETGERSLVSGEARGEGPGLDNPRALAVDADRGVAFVGRLYPEDALIAVDLETGDRIVVSTGSTVTPYFTWTLQQLFVDPASGRLLTAFHAGPVTSFDPDTGDHVIVSDGKSTPQVGTGPDLLVVRDLVMDELRGRALLTDENRDALVGVELISGDREIITGHGIGDGVDLVYFQDGLDVDPQGRRVFFSTYLGDLTVGIHALDLESGHREVVSSGERGDGPLPWDAEGLEYEAASGLIYVIDRLGDALFVVDPVTGDRTIISGEGVGAGEPFTSPSSLALDSTGERAAVADGPVLRLVDLESGDRTILARRGENGFPDAFYDGPVWDPDTGEFLVVISPSYALQVVAIDLASGAVRVVADADSGAGPLPEQVAYIALAAEGRQILMTTGPGETEILAVDLVTGDRHYVTGGGVGRGPRGQFRPITVDDAGDVAYVLNYTREEILAVDLASGDRVSVAK